MISARSAWVPWLMLTRKASAPARCSARIISRERDAGPSVARIRTLRRRGGKNSNMSPQLARSESRFRTLALKTSHDSSTGKRKMTDDIQIDDALAAAAFRRLVRHLRQIGRATV